MRAAQVYSREEAVDTIKGEVAQIAIFECHEPSLLCEVFVSSGDVAGMIDENLDWMEFLSDNGVRVFKVPNHDVVGVYVALEELFPQLHMKW